MKQLTVVFALLCIFACSSEDIVSTVEESVKPANEVAIQTVNLLDSLEIMDYIYSIIGPMAKKNKIPKTFNRGKTYWSKKHVDAYFSSKAPDADITEWYSVQEVQDKFQMSLNAIYSFVYKNAPNVLKEIGRLREIAFRAAGGGTGQPLDLDEYDLMENPYQQLVVWNPDAEEILGGYRYILGDEVEFDKHGKPVLATAHMFNFSEKFLKEYLPTTVELGRSFVTLEYQSTRAGSKGLFALDNLWDGLGALTVIKSNVKYFFGKMTMYPSYNRFGRDMILFFLKKHFSDKDGLITPMVPLEIETDPAILEKLFCYDTFKEDYKVLNTEVRKLGYNIPPLVNAYMSLSPTMRMFGTAINDGFGDVEETGILIAVDEILEEKRIRHIESYIKEHPETLQLTSGANPILSKN
jgi:hypothetical protein